MLLAAFVALSDNTTWSGHLDAARVAGFIKELAFALVSSLLVLLLIAWLRAWTGEFAGGTYRASSGVTMGAPPIPPAASFRPYPWTDRWLRDWREADAQREATPRASASAQDQPHTCRHGVPVVQPVLDAQAPVLRALSVSHSIVSPGGSVSVTWCFEQCHDVVVDDRAGYPACGEASIRIDRTRRIEIIGRNRFGAAPVATAAVVAMNVPQLSLPTVAMPPSVALQTNVAATIGGVAPIAHRLDDFWAVQENLRPRISTSHRPLGVPTSVIDALRRARPSKGGH